MPDIIAMQSFVRSSLDLSKLCSFDQEVIEVPTSPLIHQEARFLFVIGGYGKIRVQDRELELRPNTLLGILPWQITTVTEVTEPLQYYLLVYNQHMLNRFVKSFAEVDGEAINWAEHIESAPVLYCDEGQAARVKQYFATLREEVGLESILGEAKPKPLGSLAVMNKLLEFIIMIERFRRCAPTTEVPENNHSLNEILRYMYCHTSEKLTLKGLSRRFYCSESSISSYITGMTGLSFFDLLNEMRIGKTANYLLYTDLTLEDIASILGYVDSSHISKVFSARVDMRINDYRKTYQRVENICHIEDSRKAYAIIEFIYRNHRESLSARDVATRFGITVSELNRLLLIQVERNFEDFLHGTRINKACELLLTTDDTITYIAMEVGYSNTKTFTRNFLRLKVMTPGDFRKSVSLQSPKL